MKPRRTFSAVARILLWVAGCSAAGAVIGIAVGFFNAGGIEAPTIVISILFGNVVGLTAMVSSTFLFARLRGLHPVLRIALLGLALVSGSIAGTVAVLFSYPLFVVRDPKQALTIVVINGLLALIVGGVVYSYEGMRLRLQDSLREIEEVRLAEAQLREEAARAELAALQARINPHFFFNTLNTISSLVVADPEGAEDVVDRLAELFRYTFKVSDTRPVTLREELEFTRSYLTIEKARFDERLGVQWDVSPDVEDVALPGLIVQPLVENAVGHGIAPRADGGNLEIAARLDDSSVVISVTDDGAGMDGSPRALIRDGHGLGNVRRRLQSFYKGQASLELTRNPAGRGTVATLRVPASGHGDLQKGPGSGPGDLR